MPLSNVHAIQEVFEPDGAFAGQAWDQVVQDFHACLAKRAWYADCRKDWWHGVAERTLKRMVQQQRTRKTTAPSPSETQWLEAGINNIFFDPKVVEMIYSPHEHNPSELINQGANYHCRWIESVVKNLVYRHANTVQQLSIQADNLNDELWGMVMEETVMCLTDVAAHVYLQDGTHTAFPPRGTRGRRRGNMVRAAVSGNGSAAASYRIDHQLLIWNPKTSQMIFQMDLNPEESDRTKVEVPAIMIISEDQSQLALEYPSKKIAVINIKKPDEDLLWFDRSQQHEFEKQFGKIGLPQQNHAGNWIKPHIADVLDWAVSTDGQVLVTASQKSRTMPDWMLQAGFDRSIRHIAKKRMIDLIRKYSHTAYACWRCGSMQSTIADTTCRNCGTDFSVCPIGCNEPITSGEHWQCRSCGQYTRLFQAYQQVDSESLEHIPDTPVKRFQDDLDYQKMIDVMSHVYVTYKKRSIPCADLIRFKSEGMTNEAIGEELTIPRGTVDYLWNQCKDQIQKQFGLMN